VLRLIPVTRPSPQTKDIFFAQTTVFTVKQQQSQFNLSKMWNELSKEESFSIPSFYRPHKSPAFSYNDRQQLSFQRLYTRWRRTSTSLRRPKHRKQTRCHMKSPRKPLNSNSTILYKLSEIFHPPSRRNSMISWQQSPKCQLQWEESMDEISRKLNEYPSLGFGW